MPSDEPNFRTTHWSVVVAAGGRSETQRREALSALCQTYWYPLYLFVRRNGHNTSDAQDLTQAFFLDMLGRDDLGKADPQRGKFRSYLLASMRHFLANEWDRAHAKKRGGDQTVISIDFDQGEARYHYEPTEGQTPEQLYERGWGLTLLETVRGRLHERYRADGQAALYESLSPFLAGATPHRSYAEVAEPLEMTESALRVAVHRMRKRFGQLLRDEIAETVESPDDVEDEIRHLFSVLQGSG